jgi:hypothetical protein
MKDTRPGYFSPNCWCQWLDDTTDELNLPEQTGNTGSGMVIARCGTTSGVFGSPP